MGSRLAVLHKAILFLIAVAIFASWTGVYVYFDPASQGIYVHRMLKVVGLLMLALLSTFSYALLLSTFINRRPKQRHS